ncbi:MAG: DUF1569 domain-containing protein [Bacteroidota bacterium]
MRTPLFILLLAAVLLSFIALGAQQNTKVPTNIQNKLLEWESHIPAKDTSDTTVSKVSVAWHLDHGLKVINRIYAALQKSEPSQYKKSYSFTRYAVYLAGAMPRGVGKAPKMVLPPEQILSEDILQQLTEARGNIDKLKQLPSRAHFKHPVFGVLNRDQSIRFLEIHTEHHLKIIRDILR